MNQRSLLILVGLGVVAVGGGWYFGTASAPTQQRAMIAGQPMFPGVAAKLQYATRIEVTFQGKPMTLLLKDQRWGLVERAGYPIVDTKLHTMLTVLTELRLAEPRTSDPAMFSRLGVEDPAKPDANSNLLRVLDDKGDVIVAVIVGHRRIRSQGKVEDQVYVRRPNETQAWLADGGLEVDHDPGMWLNRDIANIAHDRIASAVVTRGGTNLTFTRDGDKLVLRDPADHPKLEDYKVEDITRAYESLTLQEVRAASDPVGETVGSSVFTTKDGLTLTATVFRADKDLWARFAVTGTDTSSAEAAALSKKLSGWLYEIGVWKEKALLPAMDDLKAAEKAPEGPPKQ